MRAKLDIVLQSLLNRRIVITRLVVHILINNKLHARVALPILVQKVYELGIHDDRVNLRMLKDVGQIIWFQTIVDCLPAVSKRRKASIDNSDTKTLPTLIPEAAAMAKMDSRKAGVFVQSIPTLLYPCFFKKYAKPRARSAVS